MLSVSKQPSIAKATNIDTLLGAQAPEEKIPEPPEATQDKIAFIFNNLSISNIQTKVNKVLLDFLHRYKLNTHRTLSIDHWHFHQIAQGVFTQLN